MNNGLSAAQSVVVAVAVGLMLVGTAIGLYDMLHDGNPFILVVLFFGALWVLSMFVGGGKRGH